MSDPGDPSRRDATFDAVVRTVASRGLDRMSPRFDAVRRGDLITVAWAILWTALWTAPGLWFALRFGGDLAWLLGWPCVLIGAIGLCGGIPAARRISDLRRRPLRTEVVRLRTDWQVVRTSSRHRGVEEIRRTWIESRDGTSREVFAPAPLFLELPLDGWGVAFLRGRVLVDFARVRLPGVTEGRL